MDGFGTAGVSNELTVSVHVLLWLHSQPLIIPDLFSPMAILTISRLIIMFIASSKRTHLNTFTWITRHSMHRASSVMRDASFPPIGLSMYVFFFSFPKLNILFFIPTPTPTALPRNTIAHHTPALLSFFLSVSPFWDVSQFFLGSRSWWPTSILHDHDQEEHRSRGRCHFLALSHLWCPRSYLASWQANILHHGSVMHRWDGTRFFVQLQNSPLSTSD